MITTLYIKISVTQKHTAGRHCGSSRAQHLFKEAVRIGESAAGVGVDVECEAVVRLHELKHLLQASM